MDQIAAILKNSRKALIQDLIGTATLFSVLMAGLHLPMFLPA